MSSSEQRTQLGPQESGSSASPPGLADCPPPLPQSSAVPRSTEGAGVGGQEGPLGEGAGPPHPAQRGSACRLRSLCRGINGHNYQVPRTPSPGLHPDSLVTHFISLMVTFPPKKNLRGKGKCVHSPGFVCGAFHWGQQKRCCR